MYNPIVYTVILSMSRETYWWEVNKVAMMLNIYEVADLASVQ